jgi:thiamine biosynthesis lipoprotein
VIFVSDSESIMAASAPTTRRDFLRARPLTRAVSDLVNRDVDGADSSMPRLPGFGDSTRTTRPGLASDSLITASRRAMACRFEILLPATTPAAVEAASAALDEIDRLEDQMTVYRDTSEVSRINLLAAVTPLPVAEQLFGLFETALRLTDETSGAFDMAAGALVKAWGFFRGPKRVPPPDELASVLERVGSRHVVLDRKQRTIAFRQPGVELNLGAIGKGYALDRAAELLRHDWNVSSAILHGGQSSVYAIGSPSAGEKGGGSLLCEAPSGPFRQKTPDPFFSDDEGWLVAIGHPLKPGEQIATVRLRDAALGTSGATIQYFEANGRRFGHILDPRTGWPADGHVCVSVIAPTAAEADALSTAFFILGAHAARDYCERHPEFGAVVVSSPVANEPVTVSLFGRAKPLVKLAASFDSQHSTLNSQL